uniref:Uncharacterized protein n=1 Tax=Pleodorina starrii TaxID=330485 RepID=M9P869_9CHLO|nr:hypothetical protein L079_pgp017 [Pleodorina starrii]AFY64465.1 hypothetical protein [Pleodorina starrii]
MNNFLVRALTAAIMAPFRFASPEISQLKGKCVLDLNDFTQSKEGILSKNWMKTLKEPQPFLSVVDELNHIKRYQYTNSVPTYRDIKESEAVKLVSSWLAQLFVQIPKEVDSNSFHLSFLKYLASVQSCTLAQFDERTPVGSFFKNVVAKVDPESTSVIQLPYGPEIVTPQEIISSDYKVLETQFDKRIGSNTICLQEVTKDFLNVICGSNPYNLNVCRILIRDAIVSPFEGQFRQSAVYLYGAPGTSKSVWAEVLKKLIPKKYVQEFSRNQNQFTANQLEITRLLIVSDLTEITPKQRDVLKRILGRDSFTKEEKFEKNFGRISPYSQVLIISNHPPKHFDLFAEDQALLDKLVQVELGPELQIAASDRISNLNKTLDLICSDIFNWALHCKSDILPYFVRAVELKQIFYQGRVESTGIPAFIRTCVFKLPGNFLTLRDLKTAILEYLDQTGEDKELIKRTSEAKIGKIFVQCVADACSFKLNVTRYSKRDRPLRQLGIWDIACTDGKSEFDKTKYQGLAFKNREANISLGDPFATDNVVGWLSKLEGADTLSEFARTQKRILQRRNKEIQ